MFKNFLKNYLPIIVINCLIVGFTMVLLLVQRSYSSQDLAMFVDVFCGVVFFLMAISYTKSNIYLYIIPFILTVAALGVINSFVFNDAYMSSEEITSIPWLITFSFSVIGGLVGFGIRFILSKIINPSNESKVI